MDRVCSPKEIERKRLLALQRRKEAQSTANSAVKSNSMHQQSKHKSNIVMRQNKTNARICNRFNPIEPKNFFPQKSNITGKFYMISNDRFALELSPFVPAIIDTFKTVPSRLYDAKSRIWNFHINDYDNLIQKLTCHNSNICITKIPANIIQIFKKNVLQTNQILDIDLSKIEKNLVDNLMPFQRDGVCYGISKSGRCLIADDMGLGKTIQALAIANYFITNWPLLIVVPSSVRYQWSEAIYNFLPSIPAHYIHHFVNAKDCIGDEKITIISYDLLVRAVHTFEKHIYGFIILDESHVLKSNKTARFQAVKRISAHARHVVLLSGTPALSRPIELYSQISLILPNFIRYEDYGIRYCAGKKTTFGWDFTGSSNMQELQLLLKATCMVRRLKTDVLNQLPPKTRQVIILDPFLVQAGTKEMKEMSKHLKTKMTGLEKHSALLKYYTESSFARLKAVCSYVTNLFENKRKCLLFAHHQNVLNAICDIAESMNIRYIRIDGKTGPEQRKEQIDKFQENDDYLAAVLSITAVNAGVTLTAAHLVIFAELFWNPGILCQAEDRVHRIGQNDNVIIQYLVAKNTADDHIWPLIKKKLDVLNAVGLDQDFAINDISVTEYRESRQQNLNSFVNVSSSEEQSQCNGKNGDDITTTMQKEELPESSSTSEDVTSASDFKELLQIDEECFDFCDWDNVT